MPIVVVMSVAIKIIDKRENVKMRKVLIVDEDKRVLDVLKKELGGKGIEIIITQEYEQAEWALANTFFDLVILDIALRGAQGRSGMDLATQTSIQSPGTKIVVISGCGSEKIERKLCERGAHYYFEKPLDVARLKRKLAEAGILQGKE